LCFTAFVGEQARQNISTDVALVLSQIAVEPALLDCRKTMSKCVLVAWWAGSSAYACHFSSNIADKPVFCRWIVGFDLSDAIGFVFVAIFLLAK
jgi:hypothetical protein